MQTVLTGGASGLGAALVERQGRKARSSAVRRSLRQKRRYRAPGPASQKRALNSMPTTRGGSTGA